MFHYIWPIGLVVLSHVVYQICAKSVSQGIDPFASLVVTYAVGAVFSLFIYEVFSKEGNIIQEFSKMNLTSIILGIVIVGLEAGFIFDYKAGWQVSTLSIVQSSFLAVALILNLFLSISNNNHWFL